MRCMRHFETTISTSNFRYLHVHMSHQMQAMHNTCLICACFAVEIIFQLPNNLNFGHIFEDIAEC